MNERREIHWLTTLSAIFVVTACSTQQPSDTRPRTRPTGTNRGAEALSRRSETPPSREESESSDEDLPDAEDSDEVSPKEDQSQTSAHLPADRPQDGCPTDVRPLRAAAVANPTYLDDIKPLITTKCAYCHSATASAALRETPYLTSYEEVKNNASKSLSTMQRGRMPPRNAQPPLGANDVAMLNTWISGGFAMGSPLPPVDPAKPIYYDPSIRTLLAQSCVACHAPGRTPPDLSSYETAQTSAQASLASATAARMPPGSPLEATIQAALKAWIEAGTPRSATNGSPTTTQPAPPGEVPMDPCGEAARSSTD